MQHFIASYGYAAIFLLMVAESACIPVPSELIMTLGGADGDGPGHAHAGQPHIRLHGQGLTGVGRRAGRRWAAGRKHRS